MRFEPLRSLLTCAICFLMLCGFVGLPVHPATVEPEPETLVRKGMAIYRIEPEERGGEAFKLVYLVPAPVEAYWRFKTDFRGTFLDNNRYIVEHRLVRQEGNTSITENRYTNAPNETFRWRTIVHPDRRRLEFELVNPQECGQKFHYGAISMQPFGGDTKVTHIAYFDFFGASLWVNLPIQGGMSSFLSYIARWEQETVSRLLDRYRVPPEE
jgi:hypothetical protein